MPCDEVEGLAVLDHPSGLGQLPVNQDAGPLFSRKTILFRPLLTPARHAVTLSTSTGRQAECDISPLAASR